MFIADMSGLEVLVGFFATFLVEAFLTLTAVFLVAVFLADFLVVVFFFPGGFMTLSCQLIVDTLVCKKQVETLRVHIPVTASNCTHTSLWLLW